ncbi:MAG TPA: DUF4783 domain-containing protein [Paludibacteraceae bacterium]|nr:DUF4783 domain-containing protein [Paludibacteraceae bacterium]HOL00776.1 DUF4783 domain-containing protein [Paludibacteraceae bacterium]HPO67580.1 DUF4783 domain-containing protein [Paludibacteraceae bacterium]
MKTLKLFFICSILFITNVLQAQTTAIPPDIISSFNNGDASRLSNYLNDNVELVLGNNNNVYSKQQTLTILSDFFKKNKVNGFQVLHQGEKETSNFIIGTLKTSNDDFRVYILMRKTNNKTLILQLRIEPSNESRLQGTDSFMAF